MIDIYERIAAIVSRSRNDENGLGFGWTPLDMKANENFVVSHPVNKEDRRLVYVYTLLCAEYGIHPDENEAKLILAEKQQLAEHIRLLNAQNSAYVYRVDYCDVHPIFQNQLLQGYDFIFRCREYTTLEDYMKREEIQERFRFLLYDPSEEAEQKRVEIAGKFLQRICYALKECHAIGAIHGRVNLRAIWLTEGETDKEEFRLGLPGIGRFNHTIRDDRFVLDEYSAPELFSDPEQVFDAQTDLYSLGVIMYQFLNEGRMPFTDIAADEKSELLIRKEGMQEIPQPLHGTPLLRYIVRKLLANSRIHRYKTAEELENDFKHRRDMANEVDPASVVTVSDSRILADLEAEAQKRKNEEKRLEDERKQKEIAAATKKKTHFVPKTQQQKIPVETQSIERKQQRYEPSDTVVEQELKPRNKVSILLVMILLAIIAFLVWLIMGLSKGNFVQRTAEQSEPPDDASMTITDEVLTNPPTDPPTTEPPTDSPTDPPTDPPTEPPTEPPTDPPTESVKVMQYTDDGVLLPDSLEGYVSFGTGEEGYCSADSAYIYKIPSSNSEKREANKLYCGDAVTLYGNYKDFYFIGTDSGSGYELYGYVDFSALTMGTAPALQDNDYSATWGYVDVESCNVRSSPSKETDANIVDKLYSGAEFSIISFDGYWYYISYDGKTGYVSYKMVSVN